MYRLSPSSSLRLYNTKFGKIHNKRSVNFKFKDICYMNLCLEHMNKYCSIGKYKVECVKRNKRYILSYNSDLTHLKISEKVCILYPITNKIDGFKKINDIFVNNVINYDKNTKYQRKQLVYKDNDYKLLV